MNIPQFIIIHCSASSWLNMKELYKWHVVERGFNNIGYHYVILNGITEANGLYNKDDDGRVERGRGESLKGAHCKGYNSRSIGICLAGGNGKLHRPFFTLMQIMELKLLCLVLMDKFNIPINKVIGHCEVTDYKPWCPGFDMNIFRAFLKST